ncbi:MAG: CBS domain-containing protein [Alkalicoccus sp.]|nr:MAG: CBS domain-containing protein [Alkalicoccus sp.]
MPDTQRDLLNEKITSFIIPAEEVAHVQPDNSLEHALLVLVKSGYTAIPVLDLNSRLNGIISKAQILDSILGIERLEPEKLTDCLVNDMMTSSYITVQENTTFEKVMQQSIQHPFVCVENMQGEFVGLIPRSKILAYLNGYLHDLRKKS